MCFIPYYICKRCHRGPFPRGDLQWCRRAKERNLMCHAEDVEDDFGRPHLMASRCEECPQPEFYELPARVGEVVIEVCSRAVLILPFTVLVWIGKDEYVNPLNPEEWKRVDEFGSRILEICQGMFMTLIALLGAIFACVKMFVLGTIDILSAFPGDLFTFLKFFTHNLLSYCTDTSLPPSDPFCARPLFYTDRYRRYIPVYELFAVTKGLLVLYFVTRSPWSGSTASLVIFFARLWSWYQNPESHSRSYRLFLALSLLTVQTTTHVLLKLGAPTYSAVFSKALRFWAQSNSVTALLAVWVLMARRQPQGAQSPSKRFHLPFPLPDWIYNRQRYLNLVNRFVKPGEDHMVHEFWTEESQMGTERAVAVFEDRLDGREI